MESRISKIQQILPDVHLVYLMNEGQIIENVSLTKSEENYLKQQFQNKKHAVNINVFYRWMFFRVMENKGDVNQMHEKARREASSLFDILNDQEIKEIQIINNTEDKQLTFAFVEGLLLSQYSFYKYFTKNEKKPHTLEKIHIIGEDPNDYEKIKNLCQAVYISRDLINEPANVLNTIYLAQEAKKIAAECQLNIRVYEKKEIEDMKMGGLLAVNRGSVDPPMFIHLEYKPQNAVNSKPFVIVGKGITFDSGGLNIKPGDSMETMKCDMSGAAAVLGCMYALSKNQLPVHVIGLIPSTDNRPGFNAFAPGDIIHMMDGSTVEMLNADAEGRMILADALHYAKQFEPQVVVDLATLTGSASAAVGRNATVIFAKTADNVYSNMEKAAFETWERVVRFPLWDDYADMLKSEIADAKNIGNRLAGAITAAKFLERFTNYPWIHLDIAGPAFLEKKDSYRGVGGTGTGVRMVYRFIENSLK